MKTLLLLTLFFNLPFMKSKQKIDLLIYNATVYTVDKNFSRAEAMAIDNGKIIATGTTQKLEEQFDAKEKIDVKGKFIYPGFIDAHSHFLGYGLGLQEADLVGTSSWEAVLEKLKIFSKTHKDGWLTGNGWDQNDWPVKEFPTNEKLNELFPERPVILSRIDGHAAIANDKALELAGVKAGEKLTGGEVEVKDGKLTGILIDNATSLVYSKVPEPNESQLTTALQTAQKNCFADGLTTVADCGLNYESALFVDSLQKKHALKIRMYIMLSDRKKNFDFLFKNGKIKTNRLTVCSFKFFADGALGSRGACLLEPYSDKPGWSGFLLKPEKHFDEMAKMIAEHGFQMCTHAIGDSANRMILKIYAKYL
jgi:predicted amidohydrolase YtcJ